VRSRGIRVGVVSNQSGIGSGLITRAQVDAVNARLGELLGPFDVLRICPHVAGDHCRCRKPAPGMIFDALSELDVPPARAALVGDIGSDIDAGTAAGVRSILVPNDRTRTAEIRAAPEVAPTVAAAVDALLRGAP
jgi:histidinol-phosphate phosphatase family protein